MYPDTCEECFAVVEANMAEFALRPLHVVLTGTFPELGGGSGLKIGKVKLQQLVESTAHGKVVSALSCKVTHMVTGVNPGAAKLQQSQQYGYMKVVTYDEFLPILDDKLKNPPVLPSRKQLQQKKRAADAILRDVPNKQAARLQNEELFIATVAKESVAQDSESRACAAVGEAAVGAPPAAPPACAPRKKRAAATSVDLQMKRSAPDVTVSATAAATTPAVSRSQVGKYTGSSQGTNYTSNHLLYFKRCSWQLIEGGGGGNCFFHSVTVINKMYRNRRPELFKSHFALRKQICDYWKSNLATLNVNGMKMADVIGIHEQIARTAKINVDAEYEVVAAFASMIADTVIVWNKHSELPCVMFPDGRCLKGNEVLPDTPWRFWADGGHYQALVGRGCVVMREGKGKSLHDVVHIKDVVCE